VTMGDLEVGVEPAAGVADSGNLEFDLTDLLVAVAEAARESETAVALLIDEVQYLGAEELAALIVAVHRISQKSLPLTFFGAGLPQLAALAGEAKSYAERLFDYPGLLGQIKERIRAAQYEALRTVNRELIGLYWDIGRLIVERQAGDSWGKAVVQQLARDLQAEFVGVQGFSASNLWRMKLFYETYAGNKKLAPLVREIAWSHNLAIVEYALRESNKPIGVASYRVVSTLPRELQGELPAPEQVAKLLEGLGE
jgi:predicted nuclease of restriction endonuclease-like (RecB) superfamily